ncbi:hypothetical protein HKX48_007467 [Thoreauomyces humboldtii]|nr:hypothetical protein HKX48_007467 [Thoreauomyces humboldtii]
MSGVYWRNVTVCTTLGNPDPLGLEFPLNTVLDVSSIVKAPSANTTWGYFSETNHYDGKDDQSTAYGLYFCDPVVPPASAFSWLPPAGCRRASGAWTCLENSSTCCWLTDLKVPVGIKVSGVTPPQGGQPAGGPGWHEETASFESFANVATASYLTASYTPTSATSAPAAVTPAPTAAPTGGIAGATSAADGSVRGTSTMSLAVLALFTSTLLLCGV